MLQATAGLDPGLAQLAEQNVALTAALGSLVAQGDRLNAEQQAADRLAARTQASFERAHRPPRRLVSQPMAWVSSCLSSMWHCRTPMPTGAWPVRWRGGSPPST